MRSIGVRIRHTLTVMPAAGRLYPYVGRAELREPGREPSCIAIALQAMLAAWLDGRGRDELAEPFTFTASANGDLLLAPRRSEHVHCAGGRSSWPSAKSLSAKTGRRGGPSPSPIIPPATHSTGDCPAPESRPAAAAALDRAGIARPPGYYPVVVFRRCPDGSTTGSPRRRVSTSTRRPRGQVPSPRSSVSARHHSRRGETASLGGMSRSLPVASGPCWRVWHGP
jgi:hypothetical protein